MCDAGMDGDMWNPDTPSGKPIGTQPYYDYIEKKWKWPTEGERHSTGTCWNPQCPNGKYVGTQEPDKHGCRWYCEFPCAKDFI
jgi:hypothetical protein